ncbi:transcription factor RelB isoform X1 [Synchiropus splendidus]|uniref:transcription factor RelB isoform X1 n=2 Tax=Synchiropus splendidus TaxID=270530 RepID=UPI00237D6382|nr:transcription factor RelB isoform X1 [Synchiropus splendidus]
MKGMDVFSGPSGETALSDLDILQEIITECAQQSSPSLPGPPPPPSNLFDLPSSGQSHRMHRPAAAASSPASQPRLVARGTACQSTLSFPQQLPQRCPPREMNHPRPTSSRGASHRGRAAPCAVTSETGPPVSSHCLGGMDLFDQILERPKLVVVEEPKERGMRFRYECEGRSAGSILGASSTDTSRTQPAIEIQGVIEHLKKVVITVSLVTKDLPHRPHPHCLVGKDCPEGSGICVVTINPHNSRRHSFANLGIQCVRRRELDRSLDKRRSQNIDPFQTGHTKSIEDMDMNVVRLCFQCELEWDDGRKDSLSPVVSNPIFDKKATTTSQLKISQLNVYRGPCTGKTEVYMLCDKVQKDDIEIVFRRGAWKANGEFAQTDVHRQIAIVFKTPPYQDQDLSEEVKVNVMLRRLSDQMESEPVTFVYLPSNSDPYDVKRKRKIKSDVNFREKSCGTAEQSSATVDQLYGFPQTVPMDPRHFEDMCYSDHQGANMNVDELNLDPILDSPELWNFLSDPSFNLPMPSGYDQGPEGGMVFANLDMNLNQPAGSYTQDFTSFNDLQFNRMVSVKQSALSEAPDGPVPMVQVKKEEEL